MTCTWCGCTQLSRCTASETLCVLGVLVSWTQAVWGWGFSKEIHIILTAHQPTNGIPFFRDWLRVRP